MTALLTNNLPLLAGAPNGIKKLRELILELAVRGKLVPQDPSDEPATELLKRIAEEKARLVTERKIRKQKPLAEISDEEKPFELPDGWQWVRLAKSVIKLTDGEHISPPKAPSGMPLLTAKDVTDFGVLFENTQFVTIENGLKYRERCNPDRGDILICSRGTIGRCAAVETDQVFCLMGSVILIKPSASTFYRYILRYLQTPLAQQWMLGASSATAVSALYLKDVANCLVPLPPLTEQHRIVAKVDELMAMCDHLEAQQADAKNAHAQLVQALLDSLTQTSDATDFATNWQRLAEHFHTLFTTEPSIDALKQTLLQLAVMGKLVRQDRSDETASELLKRVAEEKVRLVTEGKIKKQKPLPEISEKEKPFELPKGWCWTRLGAIGTSATGKTPSTNNPVFFGGDLPFIGPGQISVAGQIGESEKWLTDLAREETSVAAAGDILMVCIGGSIGKCAVADREMAFNQQINSIRVVLADCRYTFCTMTTPAFRASVWASTTGTATPIINRSKWDELLIPIPPLPEQHRIVAKVDQLMALCDQLKTRLIQVRQLNEQLASSLVEQAVA